DFVREPTAEFTGEDNATIGWRTTLSATFVIEYGKDSELSESMIVQTTSDQAEIDIGPLTPGTQYLCRVVATDLYGRTITSEMTPFVTAPPETKDAPTIDFSGDLEYEWTEDVEIPIDIKDDIGIKKVDVYVEGKLYKSFGGLGRKSMTWLSLGKPKDMQYLAPQWDNMKIIVRVIDDEGSESSYTLPPMKVKKEFVFPYPKIVWYPNTERTYDGTEMLAARCEDPGGVVNGTWFVDGVEIDHDINRPSTATYFGPWVSWDTTEYSDGFHDITLEVWNNEGNVTRATRTLEVDNILPPASPDIWVRRANIQRDGTVCTVRLNVTNHGYGDAVNVVVVDRIKGFVPIDGEAGTHPIFGNGKEWEVYLTTPRVRSGETVWLEYRAIPLLYSEEEWVLGYEVPRPDLPGLDYTTLYTYDRSDGLVHYSGYTWIPTMNFEDGYLMDSGTRQAFLGSNYLMITNPVLLLRNFVFGSGYFETLAECGELLALKNGVFGFIDVRGGVSPTPDQILDTIIDWKELLHPDFEERGYLAILGEDEIIPTWTYFDVVDTDDVYGSDHGYSNLDGGNAPRLAVGRILGNTPDRLLEPVRTSTGVANGFYRNDNDGNAVIMSGGGGGVRSFQGNAEDIYWLIEDEMRSCNLHHISDFLPIEDGSIEFDGKSRHMDAGDLDADGSGEVVIIDPSNDRVNIFHPETGATSHFTLEMTDRAVVQVGWLNFFDRKMIAIFDDFPDGDEYKCMETDGTIHWSFRTWFDTDDPVCLMDYDPGDFQDNIVRGDVGTDTIHIYDFWKTDITSFSAANIRENHRIDGADMDDDGDMDIVVADHHSDKLRVYLNPTWDRVDISVSGLDYADGFGAGDFMWQRAGARGEAVVIHSDNGYLQPCWLEWDAVESEWVGKSEKVMITPASDDCAVAVTSMQGEGGYDDIALSIGGWADRTLVLDYLNCSKNYRTRMSGIVTNKDLLVYRDHGNQFAWSGLFGSGDIDALSFRFTHRPVMIGLVCQSGRFHDAENSFAQAAMRSGIGVYIGATQNSYRSSNNNAIEFIEDFAEGMPIGMAFRKIERKMIRDASGLGLSGAEGRYWAYEYNFYGDPAFGTDGRPWTDTRSTRMEPSRADGDVDIELPEFRLVNDTGGQRVWIPGGSEVHVLGEPIVPFRTYEISVPEGKTVTSVDIERNKGWTIYTDLDIMDFEGLIIDGEDPLLDGGRIRGSRAQGSTYDPTDNYFPGKTMEWEVVDDGDQLKVLVRLYPFHHDSLTGLSRYCSSWTVHVETTDAPVDVGDWDLFVDRASSEEKVHLTVSIDPLVNGTVSVSQRIERSGGDLVDTLESSYLEINSTTEFEGSWSDTQGHHGPFVYVFEVRTVEGAPVGALEVPFYLDGDGVSISEFEVEPSIFTGSSVVNVTMTLSNDGSESVEGWYSLALLDGASQVVGEVNGTLNIGQGSSEEVGTGFDMSSLEGDLYGVRGTFLSGSLILSSLETLIREDAVEPGPEVFEAVLSFEHDDNISEDEVLVVSGNVTRSDGEPLPGIPVAVWLGERNTSGSVLTDANGSFEIEIGGVAPGNWEVWIRSLFGDQEILESSSLIVTPVVVVDDDDDDIVDDDVVDDDDDVVDDDTTDDDTTDDDTTDDDVTDDDAVDDDIDDDDDDDTRETDTGLLLGIVIGVSIILSAVIIAVVLVLRGREEVMDWGEE
ncbi:MAG: C25 family cysteine peptidase, partial [Thermoplasmatota archaeon]